MNSHLSQNDLNNASEDRRLDFELLKKNNLRSDLNTLNQLHLIINGLIAELKQGLPNKEIILQHLKKIGQLSHLIKYCETDPDAIRNKYGYINREKKASGKIQLEGIYFDVLETLKFLTDFDDIQNNFIHALFKNKEIYIADFELLNKKIASIVTEVPISECSEKIEHLWLLCSAAVDARNLKVIVKTLGDEFQLIECKTQIESMYLARVLVILGESINNLSVLNLRQQNSEVYLLPQAIKKLRDWVKGSESIVMNHPKVMDKILNIFLKHRAILINFFTQIAGYYNPDTTEVDYQYLQQLNRNFLELNLQDLGITAAVDGVYRELKLFINFKEKKSVSTNLYQEELDNRNLSISNKKAKKLPNNRAKKLPIKDIHTLNNACMNIIAKLNALENAQAHKDPKLTQRHLKNINANYETYTNILADLGEEYNSKFPLLDFEIKFKIYSKEEVAQLTEHDFEMIPAEFYVKLQTFADKAMNCCAQWLNQTEEGVVDEEEQLKQLKTLQKKLDLLHKKVNGISSRVIALEQTADDPNKTTANSSQTRGNNKAAPSKEEKLKKAHEDLKRAVDEREQCQKELEVLAQKLPSEHLSVMEEGTELIVINEPVASEPNFSDSVSSDIKTPSEEKNDEKNTATVQRSSSQEQILKCLQKIKLQVDFQRTINRIEDQNKFVQFARAQSMGFKGQSNKILKQLSPGYRVFLEISNEKLHQRQCEQFDEITRDRHNVMHGDFLNPDYKTVNKTSRKKVVRWASTLTKVNLCFIFDTIFEQDELLLDQYREHTKRADEDDIEQVKYNIAFRLGYAYLDLLNIGKALHYAQIAGDYARTTLEICQANYLLANIYLQMQDFNALNNLLDELLHPQFLNYSRGAFVALSAWKGAQLAQVNPTAAINYLTNEIEFIGDQIPFNLRLGEIYYSQGRAQEAYQCFKKVYEMICKNYTSDKFCEFFYVGINIAQTLRLLEQREKSKDFLDYLKKSLKKYQSLPHIEVDETSIMAYQFKLYQEFVLYYRDANEITTAIEMSQKALSCITDSNALQKAEFHMQCSHLHLLNNEFDNGLMNAQKAIELYHSREHYSRNILICYLIIARLYLAKRNYEETNKYALIADDFIKEKMTRNEANDYSSAKIELEVLLNNRDLLQGNNAKRKKRHEEIKILSTSVIYPNLLCSNLYAQLMSIRRIDAEQAKILIKSVLEILNGLDDFKNKEKYLRKFKEMSREQTTFSSSVVMFACKVSPQERIDTIHLLLREVLKDSESCRISHAPKMQSNSNLCFSIKIINSNSKVKGEEEKIRKALLKYGFSVKEFSLEREDTKKTITLSVVKNFAISGKLQQSISMLKEKTSPSLRNS